MYTLCLSYPNERYSYTHKHCTHSSMAVVQFGHSSTDRRPHAWGGRLMFNTWMESCLPTLLPNGHRFVMDRNENDSDVTRPSKWLTIPPYRHSLARRCPRSALQQADLWVFFARGTSTPNTAPQPLPPTPTPKVNGGVPGPLRTPLLCAEWLKRLPRYP